MGVVHEPIKGVDKARGTVVHIPDNGKSSCLWRPLQHLVPFEILDVMKEPESITEDVTSVKEGNPQPIQTKLREMHLQPQKQAAQAGEERRRVLTNAKSCWLS